MDLQGRSVACVDILKLPGPATVLTLQVFCDAVLYI